MRDITNMVYATAFGMVAIEREKKIKNMRISIILRGDKKVLITGENKFRDSRSPVHKQVVWRRT